MRIDRTRMRAALAGLLVLALALVVTACGDGSSSESTKGLNGVAAAAGAIESNPENAKVSLTIGSRNFPEGEILGEIYAQALTAAGYKVKSALNFGSEWAAFHATQSGRISGFPENTSMALTSFFGLKPDEVPTDTTEAWEKANKEFEQSGLKAFKPTPFASAHAVGMLKTTAEEYGLENISDLKGVSEKLSLYGPPECRYRIDCLAGLEELYGLKFKSFTPVDVGLRYAVLEKGQADLSILFTADPQLSAEEEKFVILEDDKHVFPAGNVTFVTEKKTAGRAGRDYGQTIQRVQKGLTLEVMQELDAMVELEKETPKAAAKAYLESAGYIG